MRKNNDKSVICWVTTDWFVDVDLPIIPLLLEHYSIHWIIVLYKGGRFRESEFDGLRQLPGLTIEFIHVNQQARHPRTIIDYLKLLRSIKKSHPNLTYFDMVPGSPYLVIPYWMLKKNKTVFAAHDGSIKSIMGRIVPLMFRLCYGWHAKNVHMFSETQAEEFRINYPGKNVTVIPLMPKYYGTPSVECRTKEKTFLSFGSLHVEKNIGLLIQAAEGLYNEGYRDFKVSICGNPVDWDVHYAHFIIHPELFNLQLRMIDNAEIPDLFAMHQFVVYPYKAMSQSGALKVAYAYSKPVIVSDLPAFKEEVEEGINGFFFESDNVKSLMSAMKRCLEMSDDDYSSLVNSTTSFIESHYSPEAIKKAYIRMFEQILDK